MLGGYTIDVNNGSRLPQDVASGFGHAFEGLTGAEYEMIAYLGKQTVNGVNHAFLALQKLITKDDIKNIVLIVLNAKPGDVGGETFSVVEIKRLLSDGSNLMGGINIAPTTKIPDNAMNVFNDHFGTYFGVSSTKPIALLATQVVNGVAYYFATESTLITGPVNGINVITNSASHVNINIVKVFDKYPDIETKTILSGTKVGGELAGSNDAVDQNRLSTALLNPSAAVGYAFNW